MAKILEKLGFATLLYFLVPIVIIAFIVVRTRGCGSGHEQAEAGSQLISIAGTENPDRYGDVVFIHGLDGNARSTWQSNTDPVFDFPEQLAKQFPNIGFWSLKYPASSSAWYGSSMAFQDRANNILAILEPKGMGKRPLVFIAHSLGGLIAKQIVVNCASLNRLDWAGIVDNTKGVVFLATPHSGSNLSTYLKRIGEYVLGAKVYRTTVQSDQLERNSAELRQLGNTYKGVADKYEIANLAFFENETTDGVKVVDEDSSDPGMTDVITIPVDANHLTICKPSSREDPVYLQVAQFLTKHILRPPTPIPFTMRQFLDQFKDAKANGRFSEFKDKHAGNSRVTWDAVVDEPHAADGSSQAFLVLRESPKGKELVLAYFNHEKYPGPLKKGTRISVSGTVAESMTDVDVMLTDCQLNDVLH